MAANVKKKKGGATKTPVGDKIFYIINAFFLGLMALIVIYPLYFIIIASISDPDAVLGGKVVLFPVDVTLDGFKKIFERTDVFGEDISTP